MQKLIIFYVELQDMKKLNSKVFDYHQLRVSPFYLLRVVNLLGLIPFTKLFPILTLVLPTFSTESVFPFIIFSFPSLNSMQLSFLTLKFLVTWVKGGVTRVAEFKSMSTVSSSSEFAS